VTRRALWPVLLIVSLLPNICISFWTELKFRVSDFEFFCLEYQDWRTLAVYLFRRIRVLKLNTCFLQTSRFIFMVLIIWILETRPIDLFRFRISTAWLLLFYNITIGGLFSLISSNWCFDIEYVLYSDVSFQFDRFDYSNCQCNFSLSIFVSITDLVV